MSEPNTRENETPEEREQRRADWDRLNRQQREANRIRLAGTGRALTARCGG